MFINKNLDHALLRFNTQVVKIADFGVARVQLQSGVMTAETGTYRWMAPEVCLVFSSSYLCGKLEILVTLIIELHF